MTAEIRGLTDDDVPGLHRLPKEAFDTIDRERGRDVEDWDADRVAWWERRTRHLLETDPDRQWVAVEGGQIVGVAFASMREGLWGLSLFAVRPGFQGRGIGRPLLEATLGGWAGRGVICASDDGKALRRYTGAGFAPYPIISGSGKPQMPSYVRDPHVFDGVEREFADDVDRLVRGSAHGPDHRVLQEDGGFALRFEGSSRRGYCYVGRNGHVSLVAATDETAASALLWAAVARIADDGHEAAVSWASGGQQWAVGVMVATRLRLQLDGAVCWRGMQPPPAYLPSGAFL